MGLALALPLLFLILLDNARSLSGAGRTRARSPYSLEAGANADASTALAESRAARSDVVAVKQTTPEQGIEEFRAMSGFADALDVLQFNPLPHVLIVTPKTTRATEEPAVIAELRREADVDLVQYEAACAPPWRDPRFVAAQRVVLAGLLALATLSNT